jgi:hypothetical protein
MNTLNEKLEELRQLLRTPEVPAEEALRGLPPLAEVEAAIGALEARLKWPTRASQLTVTWTAYTATVRSAIYHAVMSVRLWGLYCSVASTC